MDLVVKIHVEAVFFLRYAVVVLQCKAKFPSVCCLHIMHKAHERSRRWLLLVPLVVVNCGSVDLQCQIGIVAAGDKALRPDLPSGVSRFS